MLDPLGLVLRCSILRRRSLDLSWILLVNLDLRLLSLNLPLFDAFKVLHFCFQSEVSLLKIVDILMLSFHDLYDSIELPLDFSHMVIFDLFLDSILIQNNFFFGFD
jgi:hypothetical protein